MSVFDFQLNESTHNFTLKKVFARVVKAYQSGSIETRPTLLGNSYRLNDDTFDARLSFNESLAKDPNASDMKTKNIKPYERQRAKLSPHSLVARKISYCFKG